MYQDARGEKDCKVCPEGTTTPGLSSSRVEDRTCIFSRLRHHDYHLSFIIIIYHYHHHHHQQQQQHHHQFPPPPRRHHHFLLLILVLHHFHHVRHLHHRHHWHHPLAIIHHHCLPFKFNIWNAMSGYWTCIHGYDAPHLWPSSSWFTAHRIENCWIYM